MSGRGTPSNKCNVFPFLLLHRSHIQPTFCVVKGCGRIVSQDTYWCHTVSAFTAFSPNRIGEYDSHYRIYSSTNWCTIHVGSGSVTVIVLGQGSDREGTG